MEFRRIKNRNHLGFSLIEVLIVLIIIGIAGSISISGFGSMMNESEKKEVRKIILFLKNTAVVPVLESTAVIEI